MGNDNYKKYIVSCFVCSCSLIVIVGVIVIKSLFSDAIFGYQKLYKYQADKIDKSHDVKTVFVGDSSLGNSIDADLFGDLSSMKSLNLALTGFYGYAGSYNMIKKVHKRHDIQNVIVVQTLDMMKRYTEYDGYVYSFESPHDLTTYECMKVAQTFLGIMFSPENLLNILTYYIGILIDSNEIDNDYIKQKAPLDLVLKDRKNFIDDSFNADKIRFLKKLRDYCYTNGINLIYAHGPIWEPIAKNSQGYISRVNCVLQSNGIRVYEQPFMIPDGFIGDSLDHVSKQGKACFTRRYYDAIGKMLVHNKNRS